MSGLHRGAARRVAAGAAVTVTMSLLVGAGPADAVVKDLDGYGLASSGRGWIFQNIDGDGFGYGDATLVTTRVAEDAFDGGLVFWADGTAFWDEDAQGDYDRATNTMSVGPTTVGDLRVSRIETAQGAYIRSLVRVKNAGPTALDVPVSWNSDLGSDTLGVVNNSSAGTRTAFEKADRWVVTSQPDAVWGDDPTLAFVLFGKRAAVRTGTVTGAPEAGFLNIDLTVPVPAGASRYLLFFTEMHGTPKQATKSMAKYDVTGLSPTLLAGISKKVRSQVVNWKL
jgi:hypothetical protein